MLTVKNAKNTQVYVTKLSYALPLIPSVRHNHLQQSKCIFPDYTVCVGMHALDEITILRSESFNFELSRRMLYSCTAWHSDLLCL